MMHQVACPTEPAEERRDGKAIDRGNSGAAVVRMTVSTKVKVPGVNAVETKTGMPQAESVPGPVGSLTE